MTGKECEATAHEREIESVAQGYVSPTLFVVGSATELLRNDFASRYREATSSYRTYWG
jgi:hypothetical protein